MTFLQYIENCLSEWPDEVDLEGAYKPTATGYFFPSLIKAHDALQDQDPRDCLKGVVLYEIYTYQFKALRDRFENKYPSGFKKAAIDRQALMAQIRKEILEHHAPELADQLKSFE